MIVGFFLGSGCSFPSGQPSVTSLTNSILNDDFYLVDNFWDFPTNDLDRMRPRTYNLSPVWSSEYNLKHCPPHVQVHVENRFKKLKPQIKKTVDQYKILLTILKN